MPPDDEGTVARDGEGRVGDGVVQTKVVSVTDYLRNSRVQHTVVVGVVHWVQNPADR